MLLDMLFLIDYSLVVQHRIVSGVRDDWFLQIGEKPFYKTGDKVRIFYLF